MNPRFKFSVSVVICLLLSTFKEGTVKGIFINPCNDLLLRCQCGDSSEYPVHMNVKQCLTFSAWSPQCKPCTSPKYAIDLLKSQTEDSTAILCTPFRKCQECIDGVLHCISCPPGKYGLWCSENCQCQNEGVCSQKDGTCRCPTGFDGKFCETRQENKCIPLETVANLHWNGRSNTIGSVVTAWCNPGFALLGNKTRTCTEDGTWSGQPPMCDPVCPFPSLGPHLQTRLNPGMSSRLLDGDNKEVVKEIGFSCDAGYSLVGPHRIQCQITGGWDQNPPRCKPKITCEDPGMPSDCSRLILDAEDGAFAPGTQIRFSCGKDFFLEGSETLICTTTGRWSSKTPRCFPVTGCRIPDVPKNARLEITKPVTSSVMSRNANFDIPMPATSTTTPPNDNLNITMPAIFTTETANENLNISMPVTSTVVFLKENLIDTLPVNSITEPSNDNSNITMPITSTVGLVNENLIDTLPVNSITEPSNDNLNITMPVTSTIEPTNENLEVIMPVSSIVPENENSQNEKRGASALVSKFLQITKPVSSILPKVLEIAKPVTSVFIPKHPNLDVAKPVISAAEPTNENLGFTKPVTSIIKPAFQNIVSGILRRFQRDVSSPSHASTNSRALYSCKSVFYKLRGPSSRICLPNGEWGGQEPVCEPICGQGPEPKRPSIINGTMSEIGRWPWQAVIEFWNSTSGEWMKICGGSLVSERFVLTAAHCVAQRRSSQVRSLERFKVHLGKHFAFDDLDDGEVRVIRVESIVVHPNYHPRSLDSDVALIKLKIPIQFSRRIQPVCLPRPLTDWHEDLPEGQVGVVTGWGRTEDGFSPDVLQEAEIPIVTRKKCEEGYRGANMSVTVTTNMFCAGLKEGGVGTCDGDSGGPFVVKKEIGNIRRYFLEGITSWGSARTCATAGQYSGFLKVANFANWINEFI